MKTDICSINLENLDINNLKLPDKSFNCFVMCSHTTPNKELLLKLIQGEVMDINVCGKYAGKWEKEVDDICVEYENNGEKPDDWYVLTEGSKLDVFIRFLGYAHHEYYDDEVLKHVPILLFYDDENMKDFVLKRVERLLEETFVLDSHADDENYDYSKDYMLKERVELDCHTKRSTNKCTMEPYNASWFAINAKLAGIAICDYYSIQGYIDTYREAKKIKFYNLKVLCGMNVHGAFVNNINVIAKNQEGKKAINKYLTHYSTKGDKKVTFRENGFTWLTTELQQIIDNNRENLLIGLAYHSSAMLEALNNDKDIDVNLISEDIEDCDYVEIAPINTYKLYYPNKTDEEIKKAIRLVIDEAKKQNRLVVATSGPLYADDKEYLEYSALYERNNHKKLPDYYDAHIYTTEEMRFAMDWLDDDAFVEEIVVTNTHKIMDMCEDMVEIV